MAPETQKVVAALNASPKTGDFVFEAANSLVLHSAPLTVTGGDVGARGTGSGPFLSGGVAIDISSGAVVQTTHSVIADSIRLNTGASVGDLQVNRLVNPNAGTHGSVTPLVALPALPAPAAVAPGATNLTVAGGKTVVASPGQFLTVSLGTSAVLRLNAGTYQMKDLMIGTSGRIEALGTVKIRIANRLNAGSGFFIGPASGATLTAKDIRIEVSGVNGSDGALGSTPKAAALAGNGDVRALLLVPNGTLALASGICAKGAFLARDIDVGSSNAAYTFEDGFPNAATCAPASCDDGNPCTADSCGPSGCTHAPAANGIACDDGNACTQTDTCQSGACVGGTPITCAASDQCHSAGMCNPATGVCSNPAKTDGTACNDGNACTQTDTCQAGTCTGGNSVTCTAHDQCHVAGSCDQATGVCSNPAAPNGTPCDDGNACTQTDTCQIGVCQGNNPVTCTAADQCHAAGSCDPTTGNCSNPAVVDGTTCNDGNACTTSDACHGGACSGTTVTCAAQDQCHAAGSCDPATGTCSNPNKPDGSSCNDGNACTTADACHGGTCSGATVTCAAQDQCHAAGSCDPGTGVCSNPSKVDGATCDDGNACTTGDACHAGACTPGTNICPSLAVEQFTSPIGWAGIFTNTLTSIPAAAAVPGDPINFTVAIVYTSVFLNAASGTDFTNNGSTPFIWGSYQVTLQYRSTVTQQWIPLARTSYDASGAQSDDPPLAHLAFENLVGQTIAPGQFVGYDTSSKFTLTAEDLELLRDPTQASQVEIEWHIDTGSGPGITLDRDITDEFENNSFPQAGVSGHLQFGNGSTPDESVPLFPDGASMNPGETLTLTGSTLATLIAPKQPGETDDQYVRDLGSFGYAVRLHMNIDAENREFFDLLNPILHVQKSGPAQGNAGLTLPYPLQIQNSGRADASGISIVDTVNGTDVGAQIVIPPLVAAGASGTATINAASPVGQTPGPYTDQAAVTWQDRNGNVYGPISSSFTTNLAAGHPEGYITLSDNDAPTPQMLGTPVTVTAKALDQFGNPVPTLTVQLAITGNNPQTVSVVTGPDGTASFTYDGPNLGRDTITATATINPATQAAQATFTVNWVTSVGTPCQGRATPLDVLLVIDGSPSMFTDDQIEAAEAAVNSFIGDLDPSRDQVGSILFAADTTVTPLSSDFAAVTTATDAAINDYVHACDGLICSHGGTVFQLAFQGALAEFQSPRHRTGASPVMVFLSDGNDFGPDPTADIAAVKAAGVRIIALGYSRAVNLREMSQVIASSPNDYFTSPSIGELSWVYGNIDQDACRTVPPLVSAGGNQGLYEVRLPSTLTLQGEAHGGGPRGDLNLTSTWTEVSGPAPVTFVDASSPVTNVLFTDPGTYVLQLEASDGFLTTADRATITVDPAQSLTQASLAVALSSPGPLATGTPETLTAILTDANLQPISNFVVQVTVSGANPTTAVLTTNASGVATFSYTGTKAGTDVLQATAIAGTAQLPAAPLAVSWTQGTGPVGAVTQGWIGSPGSQTTVVGLVPIAVAAGVTVTSGTLTYWPATSPADIRTLSVNAAGGPGATLATLDTTTLRNGSYVIDLAATDDQQHQQESAILVTVAGDYKPGRLVVDVQEFTIPVAGIPISVGRRYDSLNVDEVGDFGRGWALTVGHPDLQVDQAHNVTITLPNGRRATFFFTPFGYPFPFRFLLQPFYLPDFGVFGTLTSDGCPILVSNGGQIVCFEESDAQYNPTTYKYTDPYGTVYTMGADGTLKAIQDRTNNILTFTPDGITASASGQNVLFTRDDQGRITKILTADMGDFFHSRFEYDYTYDAAGNLATATAPPQNVYEEVTTYTYDANHRLLTTKDPAGNMARTSTFDTAGRLATDTDPMGNATSYAYDVPGHSTTTTYPDGGVVKQTFDDNGLLLSQTDQLGRVTKHEYDANRNEIKRTNALGDVTTYAYDSNGNQTSSKNARGETTTTTYNAFSEQLTKTNPIGNTTTIVYDDSGLPTSFTDSMGPLATFTSSEHGLPLTVADAAGRIVYLSYDASGDLTGRLDRLGRFTGYAYDAMGRRTSMTDPRGGVTNYGYDNDGNLLSTVVPVSTTTPDASGTLFHLDANQNVKEITTIHQYFGVTFGAFRTDQFTYDADNHLTKTFHTADQTEIDQTVDFRGNVLTKTDEAGHKTSYSYDLAGQLVQTTYADGTSTTQTFDGLGRLASKTDERGGTTTYTYEPGCDCAGRLTSVTDPLGRTTSMTYDAQGRKTSMTDANGHQMFYAYDLRDHLIETDYADGTATHDTYDAIGRRTASADQTGATTLYGYDAEAQLTSVTDPLGNVTTYAYDANGNLAGVTDANNHTTAYAYDPANRKVSRTLPLGMTETFGYDDDGNVTSHTDFRGKTATYGYDDRRPGRLTSKAPDPSLGEPTVTYVYNANSTRSTMTDASGTTTYAYDTRNRLLTKATPEGTLTYSYDASGNVASIDSSNANGTSVSYAWDAANQLATVTDNRLGGVTTAGYTATGRPHNLVQPNGVGVTYVYDSLDQVTSMAWQHGTTTPTTIASWTYTYSPRGQRMSSTDLYGRQAAYAYDTASQLTSETITGDQNGPSGNGTVSYVLDPVGRRLSRASTLATVGAQSFSYDANDELTSDGYDPNGNTTSSGGHTYAYDFESRLVSMDGGVVTLVYDGDGNRVAKTAGGTTTQYLVDELNPTGYLQVLDEVSGTAVQTRYTYGRMLIAQTRGISTTPVSSFYGYDAHGNIAFLTDAAGSITDRYTYDAWGTIIASTGSTPNTRLYTGEELDPDLGLINLRARQYRPGTGRFLTIDPASLQHATLNPYLYANADPVTFVDPSGRNAAIEFLLSFAVSSAVINITTLGFVYTIAHSPSYARQVQQAANIYFHQALANIGVGGIAIPYAGPRALGLTLACAYNVKHSPNGFSWAPGCYFPNL